MEKNRNHQHIFSSVPALIGLLLLTLNVPAQEFGGNPPSLNWKQINTQHSRIIFPEGLYPQALDISHIVRQMAAISGTQPGFRQKKIDIVLQNQPTLSNGYVSLGPFRSEFYLTPRQNSFELGSLPWHKTLALHEYRHVQQFNQYRRGLSKLFYYAFGEEGQAMANSAAIPDWFFEGEAVYYETLFSEQGRGRLPYFFNGYNALWASKKKYSWMKLRNGSFRDYVPDHYRLGYLLVNYGYRKFGDTTWNRITESAASFKPLLYPFQSSFKKYTGQKFSSFVREAFQFYQQQQPQQKNRDEPSEYGKNSHFVADELFPQWIDRNSIVYLKNSYRQIPAFYRRNIHNGEEKKIAIRSISTDHYFSTNGKSIVYASYQPNARWGWKNDEVLRILDIVTGKQKNITRHTRYLSPGISDDGKKIVAVHADVSGKHELHIVETESGKVLHKISDTVNYVYTYPKFLNDHAIVAAVRNDAGQMSIGTFNISSGKTNWLLPFTYSVIGFTQIHRDTVFFTMSDNGSDRLFAIAQGKTYRFIPPITNQYTGNYQLAAHEGNYAWTSFTAAGYHIYTGTGSFQEYDPGQSPAETGIARPPMYADLVSETANEQYPQANYPASYRLFNFHSWRPYFSDPDYSYSLVSQNILNTLQSEIYVSYNRNEKFKETGASVLYGALFPVITGGVSYTIDRNASDSIRRIDWNEWNARLGVSVPLNFASGSFSQSMNIAATFNTKLVNYTGASKQLFDNKRFNFGDFIFTATNQQLKARQNIYPRIAQNVFVRYRRILNTYTANQLLLNMNIFLPGITRNHNIVLQGAYQERDTLRQYDFSNSFPFSRGYPDINFPKMWKAGANYHFPIAYPDAGWANIIYLLRLRGNIFYDYSEVKSLRTQTRTVLRTAGAELYFDSRWWNQLPVSFGIRYSRLLDAGKIGISPNAWEFILPLTLLSR